MGTSRRDPAGACEKTVSVRPRFIGIRCAFSIQLRRGVSRVKKHPTSTNASRLDDTLSKVGEAPSEGTSLFLMAAQAGGVGSQAGRVASKSVDRARLSRAPHMKYKQLICPGVT